MVSRFTINLPVVSVHVVSLEIGFDSGFDTGAGTCDPSHELHVKGQCLETSGLLHLILFSPLLAHLHVLLFSLASRLILNLPTVSVHVVGLEIGVDTGADIGFDTGDPSHESHAIGQFSDTRGILHLTFFDLLIAH